MAVCQIFAKLNCFHVYSLIPNRLGGPGGLATAWRHRVAAADSCVCVLAGREGEKVKMEEIALLHVCSLHVCDLIYRYKHQNCGEMLV